MPAGHRVSAEESAAAGRSVGRAQLQVLLLTNPGAGTADGGAVEAAGAVWDEMGVSWRQAVLGEESQQWVDQVGAGAVDRLVVAGGDGTVHRVVSVLARHDLLERSPLAILPLGTGNDFARSAGIPLDPRDAAVTAARGAPRAVDLLRDDRGGVVVNAAHVGLGALAAERAQAAKGMLGPLGYAVGAVLAGTSMRSYPVRVEVDGAEVCGGDEQLLMLGISVGRTIGGGTPLAPEASLDDGLADVVLVAATGALQRADFARRLRQGSHPDRDDVLVLRARHVSVDAGEAPLNVDGELLGETGSRRWTVVRPGWSVITSPGDR